MIVMHAQTGHGATTCALAKLAFGITADSEDITAQEGASLEKLVLKLNVVQMIPFSIQGQR